MTATYNPSLPTALDRMRLTLGDTTVSPEEAALLPDETYLAALNDLGGETDATRFLAESLATRYAQQPDTVSDSGDLVTWKDRVRTWLEVAKRLRGDSTAAGDATNNTTYVARVRRECDDEHAEYVRPGDWSPEW